MQSRGCVAAFLAALAVTAVSAQQRPRITGISHLAVYATDLAGADHYFTVVIGAVKQPDPEDPHGVRYAINPTQFIEVLPLPANAGINRLDHTAWNTDDADGLRKYLAAKGWKVPAHVEKGSDRSRRFAVLDPEGNKVEFVQPPAHPAPVDAPNLIGHQIIHVGFLVHDRSKEDTFYRGLLDFRPYWYGGMHDNEVDWVSQQSPDGHNWLEYMLRPLPPGVTSPPVETQRSLGVVDHVSIGVVSVPDAFKSLEAANRLEGRHDAAPKIGKDGKYQLNLYDPDDTRIEVMNFHATDKPCCSPFTAEDPSE